MKKSERKIFWSFLLAGFFVPCLLMAVILLGQIRVGGNWGRVLLVPWPTLPLIMSAEAGGGRAAELLAFLISAAANVFVYGIVGVLVIAICRRLPLRTG